MKRLGLFIIGVLLMQAATVSCAQELSIGGGSKTGVYYQAAQQICRVLDTYGDNRYDCQGRPTLGSVFNIDAVVLGLIDFGIAQSDRSWQAVNGQADWETKGPVSQLRSVFSLHREPVFLVARADSGIASVADLQGKRVNIGNPGSGQRGNAEDVLQLYGLDKDRDIIAESLQQNYASRAFVDGKLDAFFYTVGTPNAAISEPARATAIRIIPIDSPTIQEFVAAKPYYLMTQLPAGIYPGVGQAVTTFAVKATLITSQNQPEERVYDIVRLVFEHLDVLKTSHQALADLTPEEMVRGLSAPLHPGAERYFRQIGLLPEKN